VINLSRTFAVASDEALVSLISSAQTRLVIVAPALTKPVADALARRFDDLGRLSITVILDADPEVYRLGFGDQEALETIRVASDHAHFDLREQPGVRIGVVISDDTTIVYSPISKNIEAGSLSIEKPNAIILTGGGGLPGLDSLTAVDSCVRASALLGRDDAMPIFGLRQFPSHRVPLYQEATRTDFHGNILFKNGDIERGRDTRHMPHVICRVNDSIIH
jgi:hypothetical protein